MDPDKRKALANACVDMAREMVLDSMRPWPGKLTTRDIHRRAFGTDESPRHGSRHYTTKALLEELERDGQVEKVSQLSWALPKPLG